MKHRITTRDIGHTAFYIIELTAKGEFPVARFDRKEDRDNIYEAMRLGGYCYHSKRSWIRSIPRIENESTWRWR